MIRRTLLITALAASAFGAAPASALLVSAKPAWNGWVRAGMPSEVTVRAVSDRSGLLLLTLTDQSTSITQRTRLEPDAEFVWRVPLAAPSGEPLRLRAQLDAEAAIEQEIVLRRHLAPAPLVAVLSDQPILLASSELTAIHVAGDDLPFHHASYAATDLVVIHRESLKGLVRHQLTALRQHAVKCGRIVIIGLTPAAMDRFAEFAGCGGSFVVAVESPLDLGARVAGLLEKPAVRLPSPGSLQALFDNRGLARQVTTLGAFLAIYLLVLLVATGSRRAPAYFLSASVVATVIALVAWKLSPEITEQVTWAEVDSQAAAARFTSLLRVIGSGESVSIDMPASAGALRPLQPTNLQIAYGGEGAPASARFHASLFSRHDFIASGLTVVHAPHILDLSQAVPRITNGGPASSPPALFAWNDRKYTVPSLAPGEAWRPASDPEPWSAGAAEQLFRQRAMQVSAALLLQNPPANGPAGNAAQFYVMVRP